MLILLHVNHERSYDSFHEHKERIFRFASKMTSSEINTSLASSTAATGLSLLEEFPEVEKIVRLRSPEKGFFVHDKNSYFESGIVYADSGFFDFFTFELLDGNPATVLSEPYTVVLTKSLAQKIFKDADPIGKSLVYNNKDLFRVTGIAEDPPPNSHFSFSCLLSFNTLYDYDYMYMGWDGGWQFYTYFMIEKGVPVSQLESKMEAFMNKHINYRYEKHGMKLTAFFQPLTEIYLHSNFDEIGPSGNPATLYLFTGIAVFILIIACINFTNLAIARATTRSRETAIKKVTGATRPILVREYLGDSILQVFVSFIFALLIIELLLPIYNDIMGQTLSLYHPDNINLIIALPVLILITGILAGIYPALFLSSYKPALSFRQFLSEKGGKGRIGKTLVIFQFATSIVLILATIIIYNQLNFITGMDTGYKKENRLIVPLVSQQARDKYEIVKKVALDLPGVLKAGGSSDIPGNGFTSNGYKPEGMDEVMMIHALEVDYDWLGMMDIKVINGRGFSPKHASDKNAWLINEELAKKLNWNNPVGKMIEREGKHTVIGVVENFNFASLHHKIKPLIISMRPYQGYSYLTFLMDRTNVKSTIEELKEIWADLLPGEPFDYFFLDESFNRAYFTEIKLGKLILYFSLLAILISNLGLFGMASFMIRKGRKEISIRKVTGATTANIMKLYAMKFTVWIILAWLVAVPVVLFIHNKLMQKFAYQADFNIWFIPLTGLFVLLTAQITVSYHVMRAASANPARSLRTE